jgi:hypothetical protein
VARWTSGSSLRGCLTTFAKATHREQMGLSVGSSNVAKMDASKSNTTKTTTGLKKSRTADVTTVARDALEQWQASRYSATRGTRSRPRDTPHGSARQRLLGQPHGVLGEHRAGVAPVDGSRSGVFWMRHLRIDRSRPVGASINGC